MYDELETILGKAASSLGVTFAWRNVYCVNWSQIAHIVHMHSSKHYDIMHCILMVAVRHVIEFQLQIITGNTIATDTQCYYVAVFL